MIIEKEEISKILQCQIDEVSLLKDGFNQYVYLISSKNDKYVLHIGKSSKDQGSSLENAYIFLKFLEFKELDIAPKALFYERKRDILIETYIGDENIKFNELTDKQLEEFARVLSTLHSVTAEEVIDFCIQNNFPTPAINVGISNIVKYGITRFYEAKLLLRDNKVLDWIQPKLDENIELSMNLEKDFDLRLRQGDTGNNIRICNKTGKMFLIDFEFSCIGNSNELAYILIHSHPGKEVFSKLVTLYAKFSNRSVQELENSFWIEEKITRVNDVIWAAMKWGQNKNNSKEAQRYEKLAYERIDLYEKFIELQNPPNS